MEWISNSEILVVGLGLMGGSYARALKRLGYKVNAISHSQSTIDYALKEGIIDDGSIEVKPELVQNADAVIFGLYPETFKKWIEQYQHLLKPGIYITDVTGVKSSVVYDIQSILREDVEFIAAHPMAGKEVYGVQNSDDKIFLNANYIVTPTDKNTEKAIKWCESLGRILGFRRISVLSPERHDEVIGFVSQLTHCIAVSLMNCTDDHNLVAYTGDSFRDLTRIARINEKMWSELFMMNKEKLLKEMNLFMGQFGRLKEYIENEDVEGMCEMMKTSTERRAWFDKK